MRIQAGDSDVGGEKTLITSQLAMSFVLSILGGLSTPLRGGSGRALGGPGRRAQSRRDPPRDALTPGECTSGKFTAILTTFLIVLASQLLFHILFNHIIPNADASEFRGSFAVTSYVRPALLFVVPFLILACGTLFALGERTRKPILMFSIPVLFIVVWAFFIIDWSPSWLDPRINRLLMWADPTGFRWLNETWLKVDRGVAIYNQAPIGLDFTFVASHVLYVLLGLGSVAASHLTFARRRRGARVPRSQLAAARAALEAGRDLVSAGADGDTSFRDEKPISALGMRSTVPGFLGAMVSVARFEAKNLRSQPGLYLFIPLIVLQAIENGYFRTGAFDTPLLLTSGHYSVLTMNTLTLLVCLLLLFYTVESLLRERNTGVAPILFATPVPGSALLFGKAVANSIVGTVVLLAAFVGGAVVMLIQGKVAIEVQPFLLVWGLLLVPTFLIWSSFVMAVLSITRDRYVTYAIGLGVLILSGFLQTMGKMNWVGNWDLWSAVTWTDFGSIEPNRWAVLLNRLFYLSVGVLLVAIAVKLFPRRELDSARVVDRLHPKPILKTVLRMSPYWVPPLVLGIVLGVQVQQGFQGKAVENRQRDYWRKNILTWLDAPLPYLAGADIDLTLDPDDSAFSVQGTYELFHDQDKPMESFVLSVGDHFEDLKWTLDGEDYEPDDRERLWVFHFDPALAAGDTV
ncbi:MAG: ABC transporter permease subunit, partial [Candidatus Eisenbacteria bacterium]